jgi:hypothetical protein
MFVSVTGGAALAGPQVALTINSAHQAIQVAIRNEPPKSTDRDPRSWLATFDAKSNTWQVCAGRPVSSPQSGYCKMIDAKTGRLMRTEIIN